MILSFPTYTQPPFWWAVFVVAALAAAISFCHTGSAYVEKKKKRERLMVIITAVLTGISLLAFKILNTPA